MKNFLSTRDPNSIILFLILVLAAALRFTNLTTQSLWLDELHTMIEADPTLSWGTLIDYLKCCDPHPPLYFIMERILFIIFGHTEGVARGLSAVCGVVSVWGMYLLGKELIGKNLGLIAAFLTAINYFNITYSQEARCYIMALMFTVFSYLYFVRLIRSLLKKDALLYGLFALLLLYSHYYSLFIVASQAMLAVIFLFAEWGNRKRFITVFAIAGAVILFGYLPWAPFMYAQSKVHSFWIGRIPNDFAITYFYDYFGNNILLNPLLILLLINYCFQIFSQPDDKIIIDKNSSLKFSFIIFFVSIAATYLIPYVRSILVVPMLLNRYTIVVVPLFIMALAIGVLLIRSRTVQVLVLSIFLVLVLLDMVIVKRYYFSPTPNKTQFREMTEFITENKGDVYPIIEERTSWHHAYYLKRANNTAPVWAENKEAVVDSILRKKSPKYDLDGFWIVETHGAASMHLKDETRKSLDTAYQLVKSREFYDAWAQLYIRKKGPSVALIPDYFEQKPDPAFDNCIPGWGGPISSTPVPMKPGKYSLIVISRGTKAGSEFPHITVYINKKKIGEFISETSFESQWVSFEIDKQDSVTFTFDLDNDLATNGEDRNVFFKEIMILSK